MIIYIKERNETPDKEEMDRGRRETRGEERRGPLKTRGVRVCKRSVSLQQEGAASENVTPHCLCPLHTPAFTWVCLKGVQVLALPT